MTGNKKSLTDFMRFFFYNFRELNAKLGQDIHAIDIKRARDHGVGTYAAVHEACGFPKLNCFEDLKDYMTPNVSYSILITNTKLI